MQDRFVKPQPGAHIHLMGICGTAMASLAGILKAKGFKISGTDQNVYPPMSTMLQDLGIEIKEGYKAEYLEPRPDLVIVGNVIQKKFDQAQALLDSDIPFTSLPRAMSEFVIEDRHSVVAAGTHGKTTTTSMMATMAEQAGLAPGFLIGGIPENFSHSFRAPESDYFIIEGDEYDTAFFDKVPKFVHYKPKSVILTSIEFDHADIYDSLEPIMAAFKRLVELIPADGTLVAHADDENIKKLLPFAKCKVVTYGLSSGDYQVADRDVQVGRNQFVVCKNGKREMDIAIKFFGPHNTLNALACYALADSLGWKKRDIAQGLANFKGVRRRQQILGQPGGVTVIEDFAHHPTAVKLTLQGLKEAYPGQKVIAIFEPRSATSRRKVFQKDYAEAFRSADHSIIAPAFNQDSIAENDRFSVDQLIADMKSSGASAETVKAVDDIPGLVAGEAHKGDVVIVMSNGGFGGIYQPLMEKLNR